VRWCPPIDAAVGVEGRQRPYKTVRGPKNASGNSKQPGFDVHAMSLLARLGACSPRRVSNGCRGDPPPAGRPMARSASAFVRSGGPRGTGVGLGSRWLNDAHLEVHHRVVRAAHLGAATENAPVRSMVLIWKMLSEWLAAGSGMTSRLNGTRAPRIRGSRRPTRSGIRCALPLGNTRIGSRCWCRWSRPCRSSW